MNSFRRKALKISLCSMVFVCLGLVKPSLPLQGAGAPEGESEECILQVKVDSLSIENADMEEALALLSFKNRSKIVIGFERVPYREGETDKDISLTVTESTVREVLEQLCRIDPRYEYEIVGDRLVNILPKEAKRDCNNLLNILIRRFHFEGRQLPGQMVPHIGDLAPELRDYLEAKRAEFMRKNGEVLTGDPDFPGGVPHIQGMHQPV